MMSVLCGRSKTLQIVDGTQTSLSAPDRIQPSSSIIHEGSRSRSAHTRTEWSQEPETMRLPSGENETEVTLLVCPCSSFSCSPVIKSHIRTDLSSEPETIRLPSGENETEVTQSVCPCSFLSNSPVFASHTRTDLSSELEAIRLPSGENATELTESE